MDESNERQHPSQLSQFFDGHHVQTNPFGANQSADRAYRRGERILAALYLVTNHVSPTEPLRVSVRAGGLIMLERILSVRDDMRAVESEHLEACRVSIRHLISLVRLLSVSGFVSIQNTNIVTEGLDELGNFLSASKNSVLSENVSLSRKDLTDISSLSIKDVKDILAIKDRLRIKDNISLSKKSIDSGELSSREHTILEILRGGGELSIKDIASNLPEYSEKMIQRDLVKLVGVGQVKKVGLKRWSRYSAS